MKTVPRAGWVVASIVVMLALVSGSAVLRGEASEDILVGLVASLTTELATYGKVQLGSVQMAVDKVNAEGGIKGRKITLMTEDTGNSNSVALNALNKVLGAKPVAVLGPPMGTMVMAFLPVLKDDGVPFLAYPGTRRVTQQGYPALFRFVAHDGISKVAWTQFAVEKLGKRKIGMLIVANEWGYSARDVTSSVLQSKYNLKPIAVETYQASDKDMSAQLLRLKSAGADVIMQQGHAVDTALVLKQVRQLNLGLPVLASSAAQTAAQLTITEGADMKDVYVEGYPVPGQGDDAAINAWGQEWEKRTRLKPDGFAVLTYDMAMCLFEVMRQYGADRASIIRGLKTIKYPGLAATYSADREGNMLHESRIFQYDENKRARTLERIFIPEKDRL
jgi:branched-chain amino acid transport system substrate-binding protein